MLLATTGVVLWLLVLGFVVFASSVMREPSRNYERADGIVVLTGGPTRIAEGARLLREGRAARLLISGVNPQTNRDSLQRLSGLTAAKFECCVDLGYAALDTVGNADEARRWAESKGFDKLIVVTSRYHMPRSLAELARALPSAELIPHPVTPKHLREGPWWLRIDTTRLLLSEYLKFIPAAARLLVARALGSFEASSIAGAAEAPRSKT